MYPTHGMRFLSDTDETGAPEGLDDRTPEGLALGTVGVPGNERPADKPLVPVVGEYKPFPLAPAASGADPIPANTQSEQKCGWVRTFDEAFKDAFGSDRPRRMTNKVGATRKKLGRVLPLSKGLACGTLTFTLSPTSDRTMCIAEEGTHALKIVINFLSHERVGFSDPFMQTQFKRLRKEGYSDWFNLKCDGDVQGLPVQPEFTFQGMCHVKMVYGLLKTVFKSLFVDIPTKHFDIEEGLPGELMKRDLKYICNFLMRIVDSEDPVTAAKDLRIKEATIAGGLIPREAMETHLQERLSVMEHAATVGKVFETLAQKIQRFLPQHAYLQGPFVLCDKQSRGIIEEVATHLTILIEKKWNRTILKSADLRVWLQGLIDIIMSERKKRA